MSDIPDKRQNKGTTSLVFKKDLWNFLSKHKFSVALEIGTHKGYTTRIISQFVDKIYTIDHNIENIDFAKKHNKKYSNNITYIHGDAYSGYLRNLKIDKIDLCFIDAVHDREHVMYDIETATQHSSSGLTIVFDDYGQFPEVKQSIDDLIEQGAMDTVQKIGETTGQSPRIGKTLKDYEGIICRLKNI
jgi:predicted O-methyltransferase YrrM